MLSGNASMTRTAPSSRAKSSGRSSVADPSPKPAKPAKAARYFRRRPEPECLHPPSPGHDHRTPQQVPRRECSPPPPHSDRPTTFRMRSSSSSNSIPRWSMRSRSFQTRRRGFSDPDFDPTILLILSRLWLGDLFGVIIKAIQFLPLNRFPFNRRTINQSRRHRHGLRGGLR